MKPIPLLILLLLGSLIPILFGIEAILLVQLPIGLPLGTLLAAVALITATLIPLLKHDGGVILQRTASTLLLLSILWLPLGIYLSGNAALEFNQDAQDSLFFWRFTFVIGVLDLMLLAWTGILFVLNKRRN